MPSIKHSVGLEYTTGSRFSFTRLAAELALPVSSIERSPSFVKIEAKHQQAFPII